MPSKTQPDKFLNFKEVATMIGLAEATIRKGGAGTKDIPRIKLGGRVVFSFNAVQRWMARQVRKAEESRVRQEMAVIDLLSERRRRRRVVQDTMKTIINGGKYK
jgi:predicted DNA-binding transcriptional regulator AlpA